MFDSGIMSYLTEEFLLGFLGGIIVTGALTWALISFAQDKMGRHSFKTWEKVSCAFVSGLIVALSWGLYNGGIEWNKIPGNVIIYGVFSGFVWDKFVKPHLNKGE